MDFNSELVSEVVVVVPGQSMSSQPTAHVRVGAPLLGNTGKLKHGDVNPENLYGRATRMAPSLIDLYGVVTSWRGEGRFWVGSGRF